MAISELLRDAMLLSILVTMIPLGVGALAGTVTAFVQMLTQIQEQSIAFVIKMGAATVAVWLAGDLLVRLLVAFVQRCLLALAQL